MFEVLTEKGGFMVGCMKSREAADSWAFDYFTYRGIRCFVKEV